MDDIARDMISTGVIVALCAVPFLAPFVIL